MPPSASSAPPLSACELPHSRRACVCRSLGPRPLRRSRSGSTYLVFLPARPASLVPALSVRLTSASGLLILVAPLLKSPGWGRRKVLPYILLSSTQPKLFHYLLYLFLGIVQN